MASPISSKFCEPCKEDRKETKARALCYDCQEYLCEECSKCHLKFKLTKNHNLHYVASYLTQDHSKTKSESKADLSIDFNKHARKIAENDKFLGAQVALTSSSVTPSPTILDNPRKSRIETTKLTKTDKARPTDPMRMKVTFCYCFSVMSPEDKKDVIVEGVLSVSNNIVVVDQNNDMLKLYNESGKYLSSTKLKDSTTGITSVQDNIIATCGLSDKVYLWSVQRQNIVSRDVSFYVEHYAQGIHFNGKYYGVLHSHHNAITILDIRGQRVRKICKDEACEKRYKFGSDIYLDSETNKIYIPCSREYGVLCLTIKGLMLWFTPLTGALGITEIGGNLGVHVAQSDSDCLHLLTKRGKYIRKLLDVRDLRGVPKYVCYGQDDKLYVSNISYDGKDKISVFQIEECV